MRSIGPTLGACALLTLFPALVRCSGDPEIVYVPGDGYAESIEVTTEQGPYAVVGVGTALGLRATRRSGPWVETRRESLDAESCRLARPPEAVEVEVADDVSWTAEPSQGVAFSTGITSDHTRSVTFERAGVYTLKATSASWCFDPIAGEPITVEVGTRDEITDYIEKSWTGDLDGIVERGFVRILTVHNPLFFQFDGRDQLGIAVDMAKLLEQHLEEELGKVRAPTVVMIPVARDELLPGLTAGRGDLVAANLSITPERRKVVAFSDPVYPDVSELVVTGPSAPPVASLDDLVRTELHVRRSSSYWEHLESLNAEREREGMPPIPVRAVDEILEDHDLLDLVNAGVFPAIVVDSHKAEFWSKVFQNVRVHEDVAVFRGTKIGWAFRKDSPELARAVNAFARKARKGTLLGNIVLRRYFENADWLDDAVAGEHRERLEELVDLFRRYGTEHRFDPLMIAAQGYQESRFDPSKRSAAGAIGIMQILPSTAADKNVGIPDISTNENNVRAGVKYLAFLRDRYFSDDAIDPLDRTLLSLAAYNAGPANVARARRRAQALGFDPNRWFGHVEIGMYRAVSGEPVAYVRNIYKYYVTYSRLEQTRRERERARRKIES